ncbi:MAG: 6-phosphogluconolactonase [Sinimarinibacterium sp.]|jgi:6-phosphogluconolactonase
MVQSLITVLPDPDRLAQAAAADIAAELRRAIAARGTAHCVLTGGETPLPTYCCLAQSPLAEAVAWGRVHFWWTDERWVSSDNPLSNQRAARAALLDRLAATPEQVHAVDVAAPSAEAAAADYERRLRQCFGDRPVFDVVLLGVGEDGHVASLFPGSPALACGRDWVVVERRAPKPPAVRVSLSLPALVAGRYHILLAQGAAKVAVVRRLHGPQRGSLPIDRFLSMAPQVRAYVDKAAWSPDGKEGGPRDPQVLGRAPTHRSDC